MIPPSSKFELLCQYELTSWHVIVTKSWDPRSVSGLFAFCAKHYQKD